MKLILLRHGETEWNVERRIQGWLDSPLTQTAVDLVNQVELPVSAFTSDNVVVFSSDLGRAVHTAELVAARVGAKTVQDTRLRERHFGVLQGKKIDNDQELQLAWQWYHQRYVKKSCGAFGVEAEEVFEQRIKSFASSLLSIEDRGVAIIVGHGEWLRAFSNLIHGKTSWHLGEGIADNGQPLLFEPLLSDNRALASL